jgi:hypothetical protein
MGHSKNFLNAVLVVVSDFDFIGIMSTPHKTDSILIVDSNTVLSLPVTVEFFQAVSGRSFQIVESNGSIQHCELALGNARRRRATRLTARPYFSRRLVGEAFDHGT